MVEEDWQIVRSATPDRIDTCDGVRVDYDDWWSAVRPSETEPRLRIALEARSPAEVERRLAFLCRVADES